MVFWGTKQNVLFQKISILPKKGLEFPRGVGRFCKTEKFKEMYEAYL